MSQSPASVLSPRTKGSKADHLSALLQQSEADTIDLAFQAERAHRTARGEDAEALRLVIEHLARQLRTYLDDFHNLALELSDQDQAGPGCPGGLADLAHGRPVEGAPVVHLNDLVDSCGEYAGRMRKAIRTSNRLGHRDTAEFYTGVSWAMDKTLWMLTAHQEAESH